VVQLDYKPGFARFDAALHSMVMQLKEMGTLSKGVSEVKSYVNLCASDKAHKAINDACRAAWAEEHGVELQKFGRFELAPGMPMMVYYDTDKTLSFYKTQIWHVKSVESDRVHLEKDGEERYLQAKQFNKLFDYAFCTTVHKVQSISIDQPFNIHEGHLMGKELVYTAISRGTKLDYVNIVTKQSRYAAAKRQESLVVKSKKPALETGRIYQINFSNGAKYIGQTQLSLEERLAEHRRSPTNDAVAAAMTSDATIELLLEFKY
jgi:hypothetical protein